MLLMGAGGNTLLYKHSPINTTPNTVYKLVLVPHNTKL